MCHQLSTYKGSVVPGGWRFGWWTIENRCGLALRTRIGLGLDGQALWAKSIHSRQLTQAPWAAHFAYFPGEGASG